MAAQHVVQAAVLPSLHEVHRALLVLQDPHAAPELRNAADGYLLTFRNSVEAWDFAFKAVGDDTSYVSQVFAAQTIKHKCINNATSLSPPQREELFASVLQLLSRPCPGHILGQLVAALASLHLQFTQSNDTHVMAAIHQQLPPATFVTYLTALAEEGSCQRQQAALVPGPPTAAGADVKQWGPAALQHLATGLQQQLSGSQPEADADQVSGHISCFTAWILVGTLESSPQACQLVNCCMQALCHSADQVFEAAVDCLVEAARHCPPGELVDALQREMRGLGQAAIAAAGQRRSERCVGMARVFSAFVGCNVDGALGAGAEARQLRQLLLQMALLPLGIHWELCEAATAALEAWAALADAAVEAVEGDGEEPCRAIMSDFQQLLQGLLRALAALLASGAYPDHHHPHDPLHHNHDYLHGHDDEAGDRKADFVRAVHDAFDSTGGVLGAEQYFGALLRFAEGGREDAEQAPGSTLGHLTAALKALAAAEGVLQALQTGGASSVAGLMQLAANVLLQQQQQQQLPPQAIAHLRDAFCCAAAAASAPLVLQAHSDPSPTSGPTAAAATPQHGEFLERVISAALSCLDDRTAAPAAAHALSCLTACACRRHHPLPEPLVAALMARLSATPFERSRAEAYARLAAAAANATHSLPLAADGTGSRATAIHQLLTPVHATFQAAATQLAHQDWAALAPTAEPPLLASLCRLGTLLETSLEHHLADPTHAVPLAAPPAGPDGAAAAAALQTPPPPLQLQLFVTDLWPLLREVVVRVPGGPVLEAAARVGKHALQHHGREAFGGLVPSFLEVAGMLALRREGSKWAVVVGKALQFMPWPELQQYHQPLQQLLHQLLCSPQAQALHPPGAGDQHPDTAEHLLRLAEAAFTHTPQLLAGDDPATKQTLAACLALACGSSYCNHKRVGPHALALLASAVQVATGGEHGTAVCAAVVAAGAQICAAVLGTLLAASPLPRLQRAASLLVDVAALGNQPHIRALPGSSAEPPVGHWLTAALASVQSRGVTEEEARKLAALWLPVLRKGWQDAPQQQQQRAGVARATTATGYDQVRSVRASLRAFAEAHAAAPGSGAAGAGYLGMVA